MIQSQSEIKQGIVLQRLQALVEGNRESWTYAIFWQASYQHSASSVSLGWADGYYKGHEDEGKEKANDKSTAVQKYRNGVIRELESIISGTSAIQYVDEYITDAEWFFLVSMTKSFANGVGSPGLAFFNSTPVWVTGEERLEASGCERAREALVHRLRTLVFIPSGRGVVELGSTKLIYPNSDVINRAKVLFQSRELGGYDPRWPQNAESRPKTIDKEAENHVQKKIETRFAGKEKISESNVNLHNNFRCSWPLLTESSREEDSTERSDSNSCDFSGPASIQTSDSSVGFRK